MERAKAKKRINDILLGRFERWALPRMAARLPRWITPDKLTIIGILAAMGVGLGFWLTQFSLNWLWLSSAMIMLNWWGDSLDGTLARVRGIQRERYGFYVDHQSDAISTLFVLGGLGFSPLMHLSIAMAIVIGYFLMMIMVNIVTIVRSEFKISFGGLGPTEARVVMIAGNTIVWAMGNPHFTITGQTFSLYDAIGLWAATMLVGIYTIASLRERSKLAKLDPTPEPRPATRSDSEDSSS